MFYHLDHIKKEDEDNDSEEKNKKTFSKIDNGTTIQSRVCIYGVDISFVVLLVANFSLNRINSINYYTIFSILCFLRICKLIHSISTIFLIMANMYRKVKKRIIKMPNFHYCETRSTRLSFIFEYFSYVTASII